MIASPDDASRSLKEAVVVVYCSAANMACMEDMCDWEAQAHRNHSPEKSEEVERNYGM